MEIQDATVLLTGANGGIGLAIARAFKVRGANLIITGRRTTSGDLEQGRATTPSSQVVGRSPGRCS